MFVDATQINGLAKPAMHIAADDSDGEVLATMHEVVIMNYGSGRLVRNADPRPAVFVATCRAQPDAQAYPVSGSATTAQLLRLAHTTNRAALPQRPGWSGMR